MVGAGIGLATMNATLKANTRRRKRVSFNKKLHYFKEEGIKNIFPKITNIQRKAIQEKIKKQNRKERDKLILAFVLAIPVSIGLIVGVIEFWQHLNI